MARKIKNQKTAEQRRAEAEQLHSTIAAQVEELRDSEQWTRFLDFMGSFHNYSVNNLLLIHAQCPGASRVAGFRTWQKLGRQVRKGEKGIRIFGGRDVTVTEEDEKTGEETERRVTRFFPVSVFDMSQTDQIEGMEGFESPAKRLKGDDQDDITGAVTDWLTAQGWTVDFEPIGGETNGFTDPEARRVVIDANLSPAQQAKTALHEAAHVILHSEEDISEYIAHRGIKETEAESTAYVVAGILGMDTSSYSIGYVAVWTSEDAAEVIRETAARVLKAAHTLAEAITEDEPAEALAA